MDNTTSAALVDGDEALSAVAASEYEVFQVLSGEITWDEYYLQKSA